MRECSHRAAVQAGRDVRVGGELIIWINAKVLIILLSTLQAFFGVLDVPIAVAALLPAARRFWGSP